MSAAASAISNSFFGASLAESDPEIARAISLELGRQRDEIELIASENIVSRAVLEAQGSVMTNKYAEGYPGRRYYGGCQHVDVSENLAIERARQLFGCAFANVQPHSGAQANQAVFFALLQPGDTYMGLDLACGGHLTHGSPVNQSGKWFKVAPYKVGESDHRIDYDRLAEQARDVRPKLIIAGGSAYPRFIDFKRFREIADSVGAYLMVDMAHFAGLVAGGVHPSPLPHAHVVTTTTHKTLRGPRGGMILSADEDLGKKINSAVFPGLQGGEPLMEGLVLAARPRGHDPHGFELLARDEILFLKPPLQRAAQLGVDLRLHASGEPQRARSRARQVVENAVIGLHGAIIDQRPPALQPPRQHAYIG